MSTPIENQQPSAGQPPQKPFLLEHSAVLITLILGLLYAIGSASQGGFLHALGIEATRFQFSFNWYVYQGFYIGSLLYSKAAVWLLLIIPLVLGFLIGWQWIAQRCWPWLTERFELNRARQDNANIEQRSSLVAYMFYTIVLGFYGFVFLMLLLWMSEQAGKARAMEVLDAIEAGDRPLKVMVVKGKGQSDKVEGYSLHCSSTQCAYLVKGKVIIYNNEGIEKIEFALPTQSSPPKE